MPIPKIDPKKIFASQAPSQDVPAEFNNYERGWDESRKNNGKPTIKQFNKLQQMTDEKILWMHQNGAALPFDETMEYAEGAVAVKDGVLQQFKDGAWKSVVADGLSDTVQTFNTPEAGVDLVTGVAVGAYFNVRSEDDDTVAIEYQNVGGSAVATGESYSSGSYVETIAKYTALPFKVGKSYALYERVQLENGDIVKSTTVNNTTNPNVDMTGWVKVNTAKNIEIKNAQNPNAPVIIRSVQQELDNGMFDVTRMGAKGHATFDSTDAFLAAQEEAAYLGAKTLYVPASADPYNISASLLNVSQGQNGIGLVGEGINMTRLRWVGGAGRLIDAFNNWQYGFKMQGFSLESLAASGNSVTNPSLIPAGSAGLHIERSQTNGIIKDVFVIGFDTNIDIGVHAQFLNWQSVQSRYGNVLLNAYGQNADLNVFDACVFYAGKRKGVLLSAPRVVMRDCWFGTSNAFSDPDYVDVTIGFQQVRPEDIGKSSSTTSAQLGHSAQHGALIRPRFERGTSNINTAPYIEFKNIDERTAVTPLSPFTIDNPVMPNSGPTRAIRIADNREGIRIIAPYKNNTIEYLIEDVTQSDGSVQYVNISGGDKSNKTFSGQSRLIQFNNSFFFGSTIVDKTVELTAGSQTTITNDTVNMVSKADKANGSATALVTLVRPASANVAKFYIKASKVDLGVVDIAVYSSGPSYKFRMRNIPVEKLAGGVSIEIPGSENTTLTLSIAVPANTAGSVIFDKVLMNS